MLKELKAKSLKSVMIPVIILLAVGIGMFVYNGFGVFKLIGGPKYLYDLPVDELNGSYVEAEIFYLPDWYAVTESRREGSPVKTVVSREYIIPVGDMEFMGVLMNKENLTYADQIMEESQAYLDGAVRAAEQRIYSCFSPEELRTLDQLQQKLLQHLMSLMESEQKEVPKS